MFLLYIGGCAGVQMPRCPRGKIRERDLIEHWYYILHLQDANTQVHKLTFVHGVHDVPRVLRTTPARYPWLWGSQLPRTQC